MLYKETVSPDILELIQTLQQDNIFEGFFLVGGTALSLQIGHRISFDIDLFSRTAFDSNVLLEYLEKKYNFSLQYIHTNTLKGFINNIFVDIITHDYDYVFQPLTEDGIRMLSKADIAAMKVNAITGNGTRTKDFVDFYFLLKEYSFAELVSFYIKKYSSRNEFHAIKSLTYFNDLSESDWPNLVKEKDLTLNKLKKEIIRKRNIFLSEHLK
jgi:hypothetical protein